MTTQPPRNYTRLAVAIVVAALVVGAAIYTSSYFKTTKSVTETITSRSTLTVTSSTSTTAAFSTSSSVVTAVLPHFLFGIIPQPINATTETIPADALTWTSWTMSNSTRINGAGTQFPMSPQNYGSNITVAIYINGTLVTRTTYTISPPLLANSTTTVSGFEMSVTALMVSTTVGRGTVVSLSVLCQTSLTAYVSDTGRSYESPSVSLPTQLPISSFIVPYTIQMYAFSE